MSTSTNTHPLNVSYLVVGLVFLGLSASWVLRETGVVDLAEVRWLFPLTLVLAGVVGIVAMVAKGLSRGNGTDPDDSGYYDTTYDTYDGEGEIR
jgi:hypothetical protein